MRLFYLLVTIILITSSYLNGQTIWTGEKIVFSKSGDDNPTQEKYQDRITDQVWLTRGEGGGLYNLKTEEQATKNSPIGTLWAYGPCQDMDDLEFKTQKEQAKECGRYQYMSGETFCVYLEEEKIYVEFQITTFDRKSKGSNIQYVRNSK